MAPIVPNTKEKEALISFIKRKYPILWENSPGLSIEETATRMDVPVDYVRSCLR